MKMYLNLGKVLSDVVWSGHNFFLCNPVLQIVNLTLQLIKLQSLVQFTAAFLSQVLKSLIQFVDLSLTYLDLLAVKKKNK